MKKKLKIIFYSQKIKKEKEPLISQQTPKPKGTKVLNKKFYHKEFKFQFYNDELEIFMKPYILVNA